MDPRRFLVACIALASCAELSPIEEGVCGNVVLDPDEDCDGYVDSTLGSDLSCGSSGAPGQCRYVCDASTPCPLAWDCGSDSVCRHPSGELQPASTSIGWGPDSFAPVDFNGDGYVDVVGAFANRVEFRPGDASGAFAAGFVASSYPVSGPVSVGRLDSDPYGDVLLPTSQGLLVWRGQVSGPPLEAAYAGRSISNEAFFLVPGRYPPDGPEGLRLAVYRDGSDVLATLFTPNGLPHGSVLVGEGRRVGDLGDRVAVGDFNHDSKDEFALAFRGSGAVQVYRVARDLINGDYYLAGFSSPGPGATEIDVGSPRACDECDEHLWGAKIAGDALIADADGDEHLDLLVSVRTRDLSDAIVVARGDGLGGFADPYVDSRFDVLAATSDAELTADALPHAPLAALDFNADGVADYVGARGVFYAGAAPPHALTLVYPRPTLEPWTAAIATDVDGDDAMDVVAIAQGQPFVDVLRCDLGDWTCASDGQFVWQRFPTQLSPEKLRTGRLRSIGAMDVALVERGAEGSGEEDALSVLFGHPGDWPEPPIRQARFHRIEHLEVGLSRLPGATGPDFFEDVQITTRNADGRGAYASLFGNGTSQLTSPFSLVVEESYPARYASASSALAGNFSNSGAPYQDLMVLGSFSPSLNTPQAYSWQVPGAEGAAFTPVEEGQSLQSALDAGFDLACACSGVGDVDGDGRDELVLVFGGAVCSASSATQVAIGRALEPGDLTFEVSDLVVPELVGPAKMVLSDTDGDGADDLLLGGTGALLVFRGGAAGIALNGSRIELPAGELVLDLAKIARGPRARGADTVAVLTNASLLTVAQGEAPRRVASLVARSVCRNRSTNARVCLRSSDLNADGLGDLLVFTEDGLQTFLATAAPSLGGSR